MTASRLVPLIAALALCGASASAMAQPAPPSAATPGFSTEARDGALDRIKALFLERYVFPEMRPKIVAKLDEARRAGRYDVSDPRLFAERVTEDLRGVSNDRHLSLRADAAAYAAALAPPASDQGEAAFERRQAVRDHFGLTEMKVLPGNIRYLKITGFEWVDDETGGAYDAAMRFLKDGDAMIIDLRDNGGGSHAAVRYLVSHFLDPDTYELSFLQGSETPTQSRTLEYLPAGRLKGRPLYVLINGGTASAAEAFAYDVQQFKLGELVGAKTIGAANNNVMLPVAPDFILSVSFGRPAHAIGGGNWEGVGVRPTVEVAPAEALDAAQALALKRLAETPGAAPEAVADYRWAQVAAEARLHPVTVTPARLKALAGVYGEVKVRFGEGALWLTRPNRPEGRLSPLAADGLFAVEGNPYLRVRLTGRALELIWVDEAAPRVLPRS